MLIRRLVLFAALLVSACVSAPTTDPAELPAGDWTLDQAHTQVIWRARHMGLSWYVGRFDDAEASLSFDPADPEAAQITAIVRAASISTGDPDFDARLLGWLGAERHPEIVFRSTRIEITGERAGRVHGELSLNGITRPAVMETEFYGGVQNPLEGRQAVGFGGDLVIDRTEFDVAGLGSNFVGTEVRLSIEAEFLETED
ncbi:polyisoprenoid-binding protein [Marinicauda salina]|uniref:Polyisoprenoid-binding protein n=1 Tax=Marinicauda salina TaxID=2135793 RepID=A0A2U2BU91_9PROT|nr:YceI family protein [Marinicauda salina]PWE17595.1 polyisoprenoid-binding protein [Marinicauda salina]